MLHDAMDRAVKWELIHRNIVDAVDAPKPVRQKFTVWTIDEARRFLSSPLVASHRFYVAFLLALTTGMRQGEILGLRWSDMDLDKGILRVSHSLTFLDGKFVFGPPKSESGKRTIILVPEVVQALRQHKAQQNERRLSFGSAFKNNSDMPLSVSPQTPTRTFPSLLEHDLLNSYRPRFLVLKNSFDTRRSSNDRQVTKK